MSFYLQIYNFYFICQIPIIETPVCCKKCVNYMVFFGKKCVNLL